MHAGIYLFMSAFCTLLTVCGCGNGSPRACFRIPDGRDVCIRVEVASTPQQRHLGLMYRRSLPGNRGMLFVFDRDEQQSFTMKNTFIHLDMIFIDRNSCVAGLVENAEPMTRGPYTVSNPARYVLEVPAFFCRKHNIRAGQRVVFSNVPR